MSANSLFNQNATYIPANTWTLPANTATIPPKSWWVNGGSMDQTAADQTGNAVMTGSNGILVVPYSGRFDVIAEIKATDFPSFTSGTMTISMLYTPKNSSSQNYSYIMASGQVTARSSTSLFLENRVLANNPDEISLSFNPTIAINETLGSVQSSLMITDVTYDTTDLQFYGVAGKPPTLARLASVFQYQTAVVNQGVANLILTQSGEVTGTSLFKQIIGIWVTPQSPTSLTGALGVASYSVDPLPTNLKTASVHISVNGNVPSSGWTCIAKIEGY